MTEVCTCIWQGFIHKIYIFRCVHSDKMALLSHLYHCKGFIHKGIFSDVLSEKIPLWMRNQGQIHVHVFGKVLSISVYIPHVMADGE